MFLINKRNTIIVAQLKGKIQQQMMKKLAKLRKSEVLFAFKIFQQDDVSFKLME